MLPPRLAAAIALLLAHSLALDNGAADLPMRGLTTWELYDFNVSAAKLYQLADDLVSTGLRDAGYTLLWLDERVRISFPRPSSPPL